MKPIVTGALLALASTVLLAQALSPDELLHPPSNSWPTYNGDYSGRRFSQLKKINDSNIGSLSLAWVYRINSGGDFGGSIRATPLLVNGVLYFTLPDHAWAVDARTGHELWHYTWQSKGGIHIGNRGVGIYRKLALFRNTRLPPGVAESEGRQGTLEQANLRYGSDVLCLRRAHRCQEPRDRRRQRRRSRYSRLSRIARSGNR